ncbi:MAG: AAA family ATPase, partial [Planctomycetaceae bacterium]
PNLQERAQALRIHLRIRKLDPDAFGIVKLAAMSDGFSGAELEAAINSALVDALSDGVKLSDQLLREAIGETFPLSRIMSEEIAELRRWARGRVRFASETNDIHHRSELSP